MTEVPKIVHQRLRAATPAREVLEQTHPDADVLTAFAEQALETGERKGVLRHLALCANCREVVALALPEVGTVPFPVEKETEVVVARDADYKENRFSWASLSWGHLRWATLAAGIVVAVFVARPALERIGKPNAQVNSEANKISLPVAPPVPASQVASAALPANSVAPNAANKDAAKLPLERRVLSAGSDVESKTGAIDAKSAFLGPQPKTKPSPPEQSEMQLVGNMAAVDGMKQSTGGMKKGSASANTAGNPRFEFRTPAAESKSGSANSRLSKEAVGGASEAVTVVAGTATVEAQSAEPGMIARADGLNLQNAPAIEKAKPALDETVTRDSAVKAGVNESQKISAQDGLAVPASASSQAEVTSNARTGTFAMKAAAPSAMQKQSANWMIANGVLQRSLDGGHTWQMAARSDHHALLCYANRGEEVWAGGQAGTVLHSADNGATWSAVAVSFNGQQLSSDVTHLDMRLVLRPPVEIVLSTDTHETWSSSDGGRTWEKK